MATDNKRGYLNGNFKLFHINDRRAMDFDSHTHDFHKLIICLSGNVTYIIEGKTYKLSPWDILLVPRNKIHHSKTDSLVAYERIVIFIDDDFLKNACKDNILSSGYVYVEQNGKCLFHASAERRKEISRCFELIEKAAAEKEEDSEILSQSAFITLMIHINRLIKYEGGHEGSVDDTRLDGIISYINENFTLPLTIDSIAQKFYISRSYLMQKFKSVTGGSIHSYITQKRLALALELLRDGMRASDAATSCGFSDYTVFYKSFKKTYSQSPTEIKTK